MALTPEIRAPQAEAFAVIRQSAQTVKIPQAISIVAYNIPAPEINVTYGSAYAVYHRGKRISVQQATTLAVVRGRIGNPKLRAWSYTLDGHDFYVLKLGTTGKTLVLDLTTQQWSAWSNSTSPNWRASIGMNWRSSGTVPSNYGSNVVVGDDSYGVLWVLDPEQGTDDALLSEDQVTFPRIATGQMITRDRNFIPIYSVELIASLGAPALTPTSVTLEYSDDQGNTYTVADSSIEIEEGNYDQELEWRSLGLVRSPGRLFKITDYGAFARIDGLYVNE